MYHVLQGFWYRFLVGAKLRELEIAAKNAANEEEARLAIENLTRQRIVKGSQAPLACEEQRGKNARSWFGVSFKVPDWHYRGAAKTGTNLCMFCGSRGNLFACDRNQGCRRGVRVCIRNLGNNVQSITVFVTLVTVLKYACLSS